MPASATGRGRCLASVIHVLACCWSAWRRPPTGAIAPAACSRSTDRDDGLRLRDAYITATIRCAPPANKPLPTEMERCEPYLLEELALLDRVRVVVGLGRIGWQTYLRTRRRLGLARPRRAPRFGHGVATAFDDGITLIASYHPSQQNTFTGKLTRPMLRGVFHQARALLEP